MTAKEALIRALRENGADQAWFDRVQENLYRIAAGKEPIPNPPPAEREQKNEDGGMYCCGVYVAEGDHCPVCSSLNWEL